MNPGNAATQFFLSTPYQVTKTSWLVVHCTTVLISDDIMQWEDTENDHA